MLFSRRSARNSGGGIYVKSAGIVELKDASIVDNVSPSLGEGVHVQKDGVLKVSGSTKIDGNQEQGYKRNVRLEEGAVITIDGTLSPNAKIGVSTAKMPKSGAPVVITNALAAESNLDRLEYDLKQAGLAGVGLNGKGEAILTTSYKVTFDTKGGEYISTSLVEARGKAIEPKKPKKRELGLTGGIKPEQTKSTTSTPSSPGT